MFYDDQCINLVKSGFMTKKTMYNCVIGNLNSKLLVFANRVK